MSDFEPLHRMSARIDRSRGESDAVFFFDLMYFGELLAKLIIVELVACMRDDRERRAYSLQYKLVHANGIGEWADVLDAILTGPESQLLHIDARESLTALASNQAPGADSWQRLAIDKMNEACSLIDASVEDSSRERASIRKWARQLVWLRNRTRGHGAPLPLRLAEAAPLLATSFQTVADNAPAFRRQWAYLRRNLSGKYRVSCFGGDGKPFEFLKRETDHAYVDGCYIALDGIRPVDLLWTDAELSDFYVPNGAFRAQDFESISYITDDTIPQDGTKFMLPANAVPASETTGLPELDVIGSVFSNMPGRRDGYIERKTLQDELLGLMLDDRHPVITLHGRGGIGKTSLALHVLHEIAGRGDQFAIVWFSARDIDLLSDGPKTVRPDVLSTTDVAVDFSRLMRPNMKPNETEALSYLTGCLSGQGSDGPFIFVVDNFETIRDPMPLYTFLSNSVRLPNKVLITTRTRDFKADYPIDVPGMSRDEFHQLVDDVLMRLNTQTPLSDALEVELYDESGGHPYVAKLLLGELASTGQHVSLKRVASSSEGMLDALFDRSFEALSPAAKRVLLTLCGWRSVVPEVALRAVLMRPSNERIDVEAALVELEQSSLIETIRGEDGDVPFVMVPLAAAIFGKRRLITSPYKIAIEADLELIHRFGAIRSTDIQQGLSPRVERVVREAAGRASEGFEIDEELAVLEYIAAEYPPAWRLLSDLLHEVGKDTEAVKTLNRYLERQPSDPGAWRTLIGLFRVTGDRLGELHARLQLCEQTESTVADLSSAASQVNGWFSRRELDLNGDEKRLIISKLRVLMEREQEQLDATDLSRLAWLCMNGQDPKAAEKWARRGLELDPSNAHCLGLVDRITSDR